MVAISITQHAYDRLTELLDQPHKVSTRSFYTGFGIAPGTRNDQPKNARGLSEYINNFCKYTFNPWTYQTDTRPDGPLSQAYIDRRFNWVLHHEPQVKCTPTGQPNIPYDIQHETALLHPAQPPQAPYHIYSDGPCSVLVSPYPLDVFYDWDMATSNEELDDREYVAASSGLRISHENINYGKKLLRQRHLDLTPHTLSYLSRISVFYRIPPRSTALTTAEPNGSGRGRNTNAQRAAAVLEALGLGYLRHPAWVPQPKTKHNDYKNKATYNPPLS